MWSINRFDGGPLDRCWVKIFFFWNDTVSRNFVRFIVEVPYFLFVIIAKRVQQKQPKFIFIKQKNLRAENILFWY